MQLGSTKLEVPKDSSAVEWIEKELTGDIGSVTDIVPDRFEAYARIFHPATATDGTLVRWSDVAAALGQDMHALVWWNVLAGCAESDNLSASDWPGGSPALGHLSAKILKPLCEVLERHTTSPECCFFGLWTGWTSVSFRMSSKGTRHLPDLKAAERGDCVLDFDELPAPRFDLPPQAGREYVLLSGTLMSAVEIAESAEATGWPPTSPNLIWPEDCSWFLASEIDFESTFVGGSYASIAEIVDSSKIEAARINRGDLLFEGYP